MSFLSPSSTYTFKNLHLPRNKKPRQALVELIVESQETSNWIFDFNLWKYYQVPHQNGKNPTNPQKWVSQIQNPTIRLIQEERVERRKPYREQNFACTT